MVDVSLAFFDNGTSQISVAIISAAAVSIERVYVSGAPSGIVFASANTSAFLACGASCCGMVVASAAHGGDPMPPVQRDIGDFTLSDPLYAASAPFSSNNTANTTSFAPGVPVPQPPSVAALHSYAARTFPSWQWLADGAQCAWDFGVVGDGWADDAAGLQQALDAAAAAPIGSPGRAVFLPRSAYRLASSGLLLAEVCQRCWGTGYEGIHGVSVFQLQGTQLVGLGRTLSVLFADPAGLPRLPQHDPAFPPPIVLAQQVLRTSVIGSLDQQFRSPPPTYASQSPIGMRSSPPSHGAPAPVDAVGTAVAFLTLNSWNTHDNVTWCVTALRSL